MNIHKLAPKNIPVLTNEECDRVRETIMLLRPSWRSRDPWVPFYTLGAASYLDAVGKAPSYKRLVNEYNPLLKEHFSWLYERVTGLLGEHLGAPATCAENLAVPGFHIFIESNIFELSVASIHCDSQYRLHDWSGKDADLGNPVSFTLSIALPKNGGGLNTWDVSYDEILARASEKLEDPTCGRELVYHAYRRGHMAVHSGHMLHQIAPGKDLQPEDERITLQGHAILADGIWQLYW